MAEGQVDWRSETFRRKVITQIDEAVRSSNTPVAKSSVEMENHVFHKAKTREEYLALVARLILHVKDFNNQKREKAQQLQQQMAAGGAMGQLAGMQDPINALQNMAMSGTGMPSGQPQDETQAGRDLQRSVQAQLDSLNRSLESSNTHRSYMLSTDSNTVSDSVNKSDTQNTSTRNLTTVHNAGSGDGAGCKTLDGVVCKTEPVEGVTDSATTVAMVPANTEELHSTKRVRFTSEPVQGKVLNVPTTTSSHEINRRQERPAETRALSAIVNESPLTQMSPLSSDFISSPSQGKESTKTNDNGSLPCSCGVAQKRKITQDDVTRMQYEVLVEQKKKMIEETTYYHLLNRKLRKELKNNT